MPVHLHLPPGADADQTGLKPSDVAITPAFWPRVWGVDGTVLHNMHLTHWRTLKWGTSCPRFAVSEWQGVTTDTSHAVFKLDLYRLGLQGPLRMCILRRVRFVCESSNCHHRVALVLATTNDRCAPFALAGSIPTEIGKLINMTTLLLNENQLSGTPSLLIFPGVVVRVYHLR